MADGNDQGGLASAHWEIRCPPAATDPSAHQESFLSANRKVGSPGGMNANAYQ
jgi:hypothetical protein